MKKVKLVPFKHKDELQIAIKFDIMESCTRYK